MTDPAEEAKRVHDEINALREKLSTFNQVLDEDIQRLAEALKNQSPIPRQGPDRFTSEGSPR